MNVNLILSLCLLSALSACKASRILAIFFMDGRSHFKVLETIAKGLAEKGHQVDVISYNKQKQPFPNYTDIATLDIEREKINFRYNETLSQTDCFRIYQSNLRIMCHGLRTPELLEIVKNPPSDPPYDLLLVQLLSGIHCYTAISHYLNVPVVGIVTTFLYPEIHSMIGAPLNLAIAPKNFATYKENMNFWDRLHNVVVTHFYNYRYHYTEAYKQDEIIKKYLGPDVPYYTEFEKSLALIIANSHYSLYGIQPTVPALVEVGGIHIGTENSTVHPELKKILDESSEGFVYFSFGSLAVVDQLRNDTVEKFYAAFRKISPVRIVMKSSNPSGLPKNMPGNLFTFSWLPQEQILKHPNVKAFVTHAGGLSTQEATYYGVPVICIPLFADQLVNCDVAVSKKFGLRLRRSGQQSHYDYVFDQVLNNPIYKNSAKKLSAVFKDRPIKQKDEAVYWIEYVMRHGKDALRSPALDLKWWQNELLDIYCFLAVAAVAAVFAVVLVGKLLVIVFSNLQSSLKIKTD